MANNLISNIMPKLLKGYLKAGKASSVLTKTISRAIVTDSDFTNPKSGDTAYARRPQELRSVETPDGDLTSETANDIAFGRAKVVAQDVVSVFYNWGMVEKALYLGDDAVTELMRATRVAVENAVEAKIGTFAKNNLSVSLGTYGTPVTAWEHVANVGAYSRAMQFPSGDVFAFINPFATMKLAGQQLGLLSKDKVDNAYDRAVVGRNIGGVTVIESNALPTHTTGTDWASDTVTLNATPTQTFVVSKDTLQTTLVLTGLDNGDTILAGDRLQIATRYRVGQSNKGVVLDANGNRIAWQCVVTAPVTVSGGLATVVVQGPAIYEANGQYNRLEAALASGDVVTLLGTSATSYQQNLWWHKDALGLAFVQLEKLPALERRVLTTESGFSIRGSMGSDIITGKTTVRFDVQPCLGVFEPDRGGIFGGY
jgi:hypothetical protein